MDIDEMDAQRNLRELLHTLDRQPLPEPPKAWKKFNRFAVRQEHFNERRRHGHGSPQPAQHGDH